MKLCCSSFKYKSFHNLFSQYRYVYTFVRLWLFPLYIRYAVPIILAHINTFHYFLKGRFAVQIYRPNKFEKHGSGVSFFFFLETFFYINQKRSSYNGFFCVVWHKTIDIYQKKRNNKSFFPPLHSVAFLFLFLRFIRIKMR